MLLVDALTDDLRQPKYRGNPDPLAGHCYIVAEALYHRALALGYPAKAYFIRHEGEPHWFVRVTHPDLGEYTFDPTQGQFATPVPHEQAKGKGFLTKQPSKRARILMERVGW